MGEWCRRAKSWSAPEVRIVQLQHPALIARAPPPPKAHYFLEFGLRVQLASHTPWYTTSWARPSAFCVSTHVRVVPGFAEEGIVSGKCAVVVYRTVYSRSVAGVREPLYRTANGR